MTDTRLTTAWAERFRLRAEGAKLRAEGDKIWAEGAKLWAEGDIQWAQAILDVLGNVPMEWHTNGDCTVCGVRYAATPTDPAPTPTPRESFTQSFDAQVWAKAFIDIVRKHPNIPTSEGAMISWFANALMRGYDEHLWRVQRDAAELARLRAWAAPLTEAVMTRIAGWLDRSDGHEEIWCDECGGEVAHEDDCPVLLCKRLLASYTTLTEQLAAVRAERNALREVLLEWMDNYADWAQLIDGWRQDGSDWSEWDEATRLKMAALAQRMATLATPTEEGR